MKKLGILIVFGMITSFVGAEGAENPLVIPDGRFEGVILDRELFEQAIANQVDSVSSVSITSIEDVIDNFLYKGDQFQITFTAAVPRSTGGNHYYQGVSCTVYDRYVDQPDTLWLVNCGNNQMKFANSEMEISVSEVRAVYSSDGRGIFR